LLCSTDDFYIMSSGLVVVETTNEIYNQLLYHLVKPESVLTWVRSPVVSRMTNSGTDWTQLFSRENSGTYNNQWIVVDYNKFTPGFPLLDQTVMIIETLPNLTEINDVTEFVRSGYWESYNVPYSEIIFNISGYPKEVEQQGRSFTYDANWRANIFRRQAGGIETFQDVEYFIRFNDYLNDSLTQYNPGNSIASRFDLVKNPHNSLAYGAIDAKVTNYDLSKNLMAAVIDGPTNQGIPSFSWANWKNCLHAGQPEVFDFEWIYVNVDDSWVPK